MVHERRPDRADELLDQAHVFGDDFGFAVHLQHEGNPTTRAFLDACDSLGMLVIGEAFDGWRTRSEEHTSELQSRI